jgi:hypothetical protein
MPRPSPELDPDGSEASVTEGSISPGGRDLVKLPSESELVAWGISPHAFAIRVAMRLLATPFRRSIVLRGL